MTAHTAMAGDGADAIEGRAFVYVLPLHIEDLLKVGFSRDPLARMQQLHRRWFDFFDIDRVVIVEADRVREAQRIESALKHRLAEHRAQAPLEIVEAAGGHTAWVRGAGAILDAAAARFAEDGYRVHRDARRWLHTRLVARSARLFEWSTQTFEQMQLAASVAEFAVQTHLANTLRDALDALHAFDIDVSASVPDEVAAWYADRQT